MTKRYKIWAYIEEEDEEGECRDICPDGLPVALGTYHDTWQEALEYLNDHRLEGTPPVDKEKPFELME